MTHHLQSVRRWSFSALVSLLLGACGGGGGNGNGASGPTDFNGVVRSTLLKDESSEPVDVEDTEFVFTDEPDAFDDLTQ